jgi:2-oxoglutarate dehydrogenase E2 component (dihydrolipoamide succinyltransferase)
MADEQNIPLGGVTGTGRGGVISKPDVIEQRAAAQAPVAPSFAPGPLPIAQSSRETREKMSVRRKRIADNLLNSHLNTARLTTFNEVDMTAVIATRSVSKKSTASNSRSCRSSPKPR